MLGRTKVAGEERERAGFTLVELLVVIAIIGLLVGMVMPAVQYARNSSRRAQCLSQMRQIAIAMDSYMDFRGSRALYPFAAQLPSVSATAPKPRPSIVKVLETYMETNAQVYNCPSDIYYKTTSSSGDVYDYDKTYFSVEGTSYEYNADTPYPLAGKTRAQITESSGNMNKDRKSSNVVLANDYEPVHGAKNDAGSRNFVFLDGHADSP